MTPDEQFKQLAESMLAATEAAYGTQSVQGAQRMFGSTSLKTGGKMFAFLDKRTKRLVVKLPEKRIASLVDEGSGERYDAGNGRPQREWFVVGADDPTNWLQFATEALEFVGQTGKNGAGA
jgi:hypothetical protein